MKPQTTYDKLMVAAALIDREECYYFMENEVPSNAEECGCVLGWIAYVFGDNTIEDAAKRFADGEMDFYRKMTYIWNQDHYREWHDNRHIAAAGIRKLAKEYEHVSV